VGPVTLVFGGDVAPGRVATRNGSLTIKPIGGPDPLAFVIPVLEAADLAVINLEGALSDAPLAPAQAGAIRLIAPRAFATTLARAGVDMVSVANNHALDAGPEGLVATEAALGAVGVDALGGHRRHVVREIGGLRVAFMAVTDRLNAGVPGDWLRRLAWRPSDRLHAELPAETARFVREVQADHHVVLIHWGHELAMAPTAAQRRLGRALVDAGARLVIGHHSHTLQPVERHGAGLIAYSLGNLLFDMRHPRTRTAGLLKVRLDAGGIVDASLTRTRAGPEDAPRLTPGPEPR
jgi:poly-gamma-glutamate synthesis protein (capsule biosynthesis protein)